MHQQFVEVSAKLNPNSPWYDCDHHEIGGSSRVEAAQRKVSSGPSECRVNRVSTTEHASLVEPTHLEVSDAHEAGSGTNKALVLFRRGNPKPQTPKP